MTNTTQTISQISKLREGESLHIAYDRTELDGYYSSAVTITRTEDGFTVADSHDALEAVETAEQALSLAVEYASSMGEESTWDVALEGLGIPSEHVREII